MGILKSLYDSARGKAIYLHQPHKWPMERHDFAIFLSIEINKAMDSYADARQAPIDAGAEVYQHTLSYSADDDELSHLSKSFLASIIATGVVADNIKTIKANPNIEKIYANKAADIFDRLVAHCGKVYGAEGESRSGMLVKICLEYSKMNAFAERYSKNKQLQRPAKKILPAEKFLFSSVSTWPKTGKEIVDTLLNVLCTSYLSWSGMPQEHKNMPVEIFKNTMWAKASEQGTAQWANKFALFFYAVSELITVNDTPAQFLSKTDKAIKSISLFMTEYILDHVTTYELIEIDKIMNMEQFTSTIQEKQNEYRIAVTKKYEQEQREADKRYVASLREQQSRASQAQTEHFSAKQSIQQNNKVEVDSGGCLSVLKYTFLIAGIFVFILALGFLVRKPSRNNSRLTRHQETRPRNRAQERTARSTIP